MGKTPEKLQIIHRFSGKNLRIPNLHHIHINTKRQDCKYRFFFFRYQFIGFTGKDLTKRKIQYFFIDFCFPMLYDNIAKYGIPDCGKKFPDSVLLYIS